MVEMIAFAGIDTAKYTREFFMSIADSISLKIAAEGLVLSKVISFEWQKLIDDFLPEIEPYLGLETRIPNRIGVNLVLEKYREKFSKFPDKVLPEFNKYILNAYSYGIEFTAHGRTRVEKDQEDIIRNIMRVTHASRKRVTDAMGRWFKQTQGQYFERFIIPKTNNLIKVMEEYNEETSMIYLRDLGISYRKFAKAEGYWSAISDFDTATASRFAQTDALYEAGYSTYVIRAVVDSKTCAFCAEINGTEYAVADGLAQKEDMLSMDAEAAANAYPWPTKDNIKGGTFRLPPFHSHCYAEGTEVYTNEGWKEFPDLKGTEQFLSRTLTGEMEWLPSINYVGYDYSGEMIHLQSKWFDLLVTPQHSQVYEKRVDRGSKGRKYEPLLSTIEDMIKLPEYRIPRTGIWSGTNSVSVEFATFLGYYLSEGSVVHQQKDGAWEYQISIAQNKGKKYDLIKKACMAVSGIGTVHLGKDKIYISGNPLLGEWLLSLGHSGNRYVPSIIKASTPEVITSFLESYVVGDGSNQNSSWKEKQLVSKSVDITTSSRRMSEDIGELILKVGGYPSFSFVSKKGDVMRCPRTKKEYKINNDQIRILWNRTKYATSQNIKVTRVQYSGYVADVELPKNHILWIRYKGKTCFSGNCRCWLEGRKLGGDKLQRREISSFREMYPNNVALPNIEDEMISEYISDCLNEKGLSKRCLAQQEIYCTNVSLGFRGEKILGDIIGVGHPTEHTHPIDWVIEKGELFRDKGFALECKTLRAENADLKIKMRPDAITRKLNFANDGGYKKGTVSIVLAESGDAVVYFKPGYGGFRPGGMTKIGAVKEGVRGTQFDDAVKKLLIQHLEKL